MTLWQRILRLLAAARWRSAIALALTAWVSVATPALGSGAAMASAESVATHVEPQDWQRRRAEFAGIVQGAREGNPIEKRAFDEVLTEFESHPFARTPMENLEIIGVSSLPKQGADPGLALVVGNLVLGWYDALRFGSESGRAEIVNNEDFFKKAFLLAGADIPTKTAKFLQDNPKRAAQLVAQGIGLAEKFRQTATYDRRWPTAYGLERLTCATDQGPCASPASMPKEQWDQAWQDAKRRVVVYFQVGPSGEAH
jgi:hypothetical protein